MAKQSIQTWFQGAQGGSQPFINPASGDRTFSFGLRGYQAHTWGTDIHADKKNTHKTKKTKNYKKVMVNQETLTMMTIPIYHRKKMQNTQEGMDTFIIGSETLAGVLHYV